MSQQKQKNDPVRWTRSVYFWGAYATTLLFLGLGLADDFTRGFYMVNDWIRSQSAVGGTVWSLLMLIFLPGAIFMLLTALWRLGRELEDAAVDYLTAIQRRSRKLLGIRSKDSESEQLCSDRQ